MPDNNPWSIEDLLPTSGPFSPARQAREAVAPPGAVAPPTAPPAQTLQTPLHDLLTQGGVTSSQSMPGIGMGSTQGLRESSSNIGAGAMSPETMQYMARNDLSSMLSSPSGTPEQRTGWQSELGRMTAEDTEKRREALELGKPGREQAARVSAEKELSAVRIAEAKAAAGETRETQSQAIKLASEARLNEIMMTPFQSGPLQGRKPIDLETPQGQQMLDEVLNRLMAGQTIKDVGGFITAYGAISKMDPEALGHSPQQREASRALLLARLLNAITGRPLRDFLKASPNGGLTSNYSNTLGQMEPPGANPAGQIEIGPKKPLSGYQGQPLGSRIQNPGSAPVSGLGDFLTE